MPTCRAPTIEIRPWNRTPALAKATLGAPNGTPPASIPPATPQQFSSGSLRVVSGNRLRRVANRGVLDAELLEIRLVLGRVVVVFAHLGTVPVHNLLVQPDRGLVLGTHQ